MGQTPTPQQVKGIFLDVYLLYVKWITVFARIKNLMIKQLIKEFGDYYEEG